LRNMFVKMSVVAAFALLLGAGVMAAGSAPAHAATVQKTAATPSLCIYHPYPQHSICCNFGFSRGDCTGHGHNGDCDDYGYGRNSGYGYGYNNCGYGYGNGYCTYRNGNGYGYNQWSNNNRWNDNRCCNSGYGYGYGYSNGWGYGHGSDHDTGKQR
jgi:hypothetical protein